MVSFFNRLAAPAAVAIAALAASVVPACAMSVSPIHTEMTTTGRASRAQITVSNDSGAPLPVEAAIDSFAMDEAGGLKRTKAGDEFLVFPPQALIPAGGSQVFRVQWVGEPDLQQSRSYMLSLTQIPVKLPKGKSAVQVVMSFGVMINVAPPQGRPELKVVGSGIERDKQGKLHPTVTVEDSSSVHGLLENSAIRVVAGSYSKTYSAQEVSQQIGIGLVQPGRRRKFVLPDVLPNDASQVQVSLEHQAKQ